MKLLFDHNLSPRLPRELNDLFPGSAHVRDLDLHMAPDAAVWSHALEQGFAIVSKDSDFQQRAFLEGAPPKVIWVNLGNCTTEEVEHALRVQRDAIERFGQDREEAFPRGSGGPPDLRVGQAA